jgi:nucleoid-associated protein YgaU
MTRETKIGLLVGLAFIIVIGILLSDHMTSATEPPKAPLSVAGSNVRESVLTPAAPGGSPAVAAVGAGQGAMAPTQPVMTGAEISASQRASVQPPIHVGPAHTQYPIVVQQGPVPQQARDQVESQARAAELPVVIAPPGGRAPAGHPLEQLANRHGEEIVAIGGPGQQSPRQQPVPMAALREYKAQPGDSLSKIASRYLGANTKANREAIMRVNPTLQANPDRIVEGRTYVLPPPPTADGATGAAAMATAAPATPSTARSGVTNETAAAPTGENFTWYTVKENENLWKIAAAQLGSGNAWTQIRDLNQDILKGQDQVRSNTRIRVPNRPVASAD